LTYFLKI